MCKPQNVKLGFDDQDDTNDNELQYHQMHQLRIRLKELYLNFINCKFLAALAAAFGKIRPPPYALRPGGK